jgi:hypothetical protein
MRAGYLKILCGILVVFMTMAGFSSLLTVPSTGNITINDFTAGASRQIIFPIGGGSDNGTFIELPIDANAQDSTLRIVGEASSGQYPLHVELDIGDDGLVEYKFDEIGGGAMGFQKSFWNGVNNTPFNMGQFQYNHTMGFRLPKGVTVESASVDLWAEEQDYLDEVIELNLPGGGREGPWDDVHDFDPILIVFNNQLLDIYRSHSEIITNSTDGDLVVNWTTDGLNWGYDRNTEVTKDPDTIWPHTSTGPNWWGNDMRPSAAIYNDGGGNRLYIAWESNSTKAGPYYIDPPDPDYTRGVTSGWDKDIVITSSATGTSWSYNTADYIEITSPFNEDGNTTSATGYNSANKYPHDWLAQLVEFDGRLYCAWVTNNTHSPAGQYGGSDIMITWSTDPRTQAGWDNTSRIVNITEGDNWNGSDFNPALIEFQNKLFIFWQTNDTSRGNGSDYDILYRYTSDGDNWSPTYQLSPKGTNDWTEGKMKGETDGEFWDMTPHPIVFNGKLGVAWETENWRYTYNRTWDQPVNDQTDADLVVAWSSDGMSWDLQKGVNTFEITPMENDWGDHFPQTAKLDPDGVGPQPERLYATWNSNDQGISIWDYDIMYSYSTDGESWTPQRFASTHPDYGGGDFWAHIASFNGWIYVTWWSNDDKDGPKSGMYADGDDADVLIRRIVPSYLPVPNVSIDVANDGSKEFGPSQLDTSVVPLDIKSSLNSALTSASTFHSDVYGNEYVDIVINVSSPDVPCRLWLSNINITYTKPGGNFYVDVPDFSYALNEYIRIHKNDAEAADGTVTIPISISAESAAKLTLTNVNVEYNRKPTIEVTTPGDTLAFAKETFLITWTAEDPDDLDAAITLFFDDDNVPGSEVEIDTTNDSITVSSDTFFLWDTSSLPLGSEYFVKAVIDDGVDSAYSYSKSKVKVTRDNVPPTITITKPSNLNPKTEYDFWIEWIDSDEDSHAWIYLYYDTNTNPADGKTLIAEEIPEDGAFDKYQWIIGNDVGVGKYYIYAEIKDEENASFAYSPGFIEVIPPSLNAPVEIKIDHNIDATGGTLKTHDILPRLTWSNHPDNPIPDATNLIEYAYIVNVGTSATSNDDILKNYETKATHVKLANNLTFGETYYIEVKVTDGRGHFSPALSSTFDIVNNAPGAPTIAIAPDMPTTRSTLEVKIMNGSLDTDGDLVEYTYEWTLNNVPTEFTGTTIGAEETKKGDTWQVKVTPWDLVGGIRRAAGTTATAVATIQNSAPIPKVIAPADNTVFSAGDEVKFIAEGDDPDAEDTDDKLRFEWSSQLDGALGTGSTLTKSNMKRGIHVITLTVSDDDKSANTTFKVEIVKGTGPSETDPDEKTNAALIIGGVVAAIVVVLLLVMLMFMRRKKGEEAPMYPELDKTTEELPTGPSAEELYSADTGAEGELPPPAEGEQAPGLPPVSPPEGGEPLPQLPEGGAEEAPGGVEPAPEELPPEGTEPPAEE